MNTKSNLDNSALPILHMSIVILLLLQISFNEAIKTEQKHVRK